jgi:hypothetical protein
MLSNSVCRRPKRRAAVAGILLMSMTVLLPLLSGCKSQSSMSKAEEENFKGGPMPAGFMEKHGGGEPKKPTQ